MSEKTEAFLKALSALLKQYDATIVATAGLENRLCVSIFEDEATFTDLQYAEEINEDNVMEAGR